MLANRSLVAAALALTVAVLLGACTGDQTVHPMTDEDDEFGTIIIYDVLTDGTLSPQADGLTAEVWDTFTRVATIQFAAEVMLKYQVGDAPASDTLAYVYEDYDNPKLWVLAANLATSEDQEQLIATLIHEYAHILTLNQQQMDGEAERCNSLELDEGCPADESMLRAFSDEFWAAYGNSAPDIGNSDENVAYDFYLEHEDDFVTDYAATNVVEDIAETFMTFVLEDYAGGDSVIARKLAFFQDYPEMVAIRERIRAEFAAELGLAI